jgi:hypothetical protein
MKDTGAVATSEDGKHVETSDRVGGARGSAMTGRPGAPRVPAAGCVARPPVHIDQGVPEITIDGSSPRMIPVRVMGKNAQVEEYTLRVTRKGRAVML